MEKLHLVAITTKDNKCIYVSKVKNVNDKELALLNKQAFDYETEQQKEIGCLKKSIALLEKEIEELKHEIKVLKGEEE